MSTSTSGVVSAVGLNHVVLDKRTGSPTVQSNQTVTPSIDGSSVLDGAANHQSWALPVMLLQGLDSPSSTSLPANAGNDISVGAAPLQRVGTSANGEFVGSILDVVGKVVATRVADLVSSNRLAALLNLADWCSEGENGIGCGEEDALEGRHV
jgi:hypothetical protein